jgi:hypothetical protein
MINLSLKENDLGLFEIQLNNETFLVDSLSDHNIHYFYIRDRWYNIQGFLKELKKIGASDESIMLIALKYV